jgi:hypothetical protein
VNTFDRFFGWCRQTLDILCDRPEHLQRISIIGAGFTSALLVVGVVALLTWFGQSAPALALLVVPILGSALYMLIGAFIICIIVLLGLVKGLQSLKASLPGGASVEIETASETTNTTTTTTLTP